MGGSARGDLEACRSGRLLCDETVAVAAGGPAKDADELWAEAVAIKDDRRAEPSSSAGWVASRAIEMVPSIDPERFRWLLN